MLPSERTRYRLGWRGLLGRVVTLLAICLAAPALAQTEPTVKELLGRAQSQAEKKAVEDLIEKLRPRSDGQPKPATSDAEAKRETTTPGGAPAAAAAKEPGEATPREGTAAAPEPKPASAEKSAPGTKTSLEERPSKPDERPPTQPPPAEARPETAPERVVEKAERKQLPSVDLVVQFEYDSATLAPAAMETLKPLGLALSDERLAEGAFLVAGHTDAKGSTQYNLKLSERRADAVRQYLITNFNIDPGRLIAKGFGEKHLKVPERPRAAENRRVQIVNYKE